MPDQRIQFVKTGRACYISHLDLMRTFQRAFLRAGIHIRHTEGFNPHAYVSIPLPLSVGFSSQCEILEFGLPEGADMEAVPWRLTRVLPEGITVTRCYDAERPYKELCYVNYIITLEYDAGAPVGAENTIRRCWAEKSLVVSKKIQEGQERADTGGPHSADSAGGLRGATGFHRAGHHSARPESGTKSGVDCGGDPGTMPGNGARLCQLSPQASAG